MNKIVAISKYGFKLDSLRNDWEKVDKSLLKRDIFRTLEKGVEIQILERNPKGFILDFKIPITASSENLEQEPLITPHASSQKSSPVQDSIRYAQCVNIAFNSLKEERLNFTNDKDGTYIFIKLAFDIADEIYKEFNKRCSR